MSDLWKSLAARAAITLDDDRVALLERYLDGLTAANETMNLTRIVDRESARVRHVADALTLLPYLPPAAGRRSLLQVADVGTGGGVPGVILAIARPDSIVTLIDSTKKKLDAVQAICDGTGVKNVCTVHSRADEVKLLFDVVTVRAVGTLDTIVGWCHGLLKPGAVLLAMKGPKAADELLAAERSLRLRRLTADTIDVAEPHLPGHVIVRLTKRP